MSIAQEWIDQGKEIGEEIGKKIGKVEEQHENIFAILKVRFGEPPSRLYLQLTRITDLAQLRTLRDLALTTSSVDNFSLAIATMQSGDGDEMTE